MSARVAIDDPITVVCRNATLCLVVDKVERKAFYCDSTDLDFVSALILEHDQEDILWVRGWHTPDSDEVKAARVAQGIGDAVEQALRLTYNELKKQVDALPAEKIARDQREREAGREPRQRQQTSGWGGGRSPANSDDAWDQYRRRGGR